MDAKIADGRRTAREPLLDLNEIQGNILVPFGGPVQHHLYLRLTGNPHRWLARVVPRVTSTRALMDLRAGGGGGTSVGVSFSASGLRMLGLRPDTLLDVPFQDGLAARSSLLGDPVDPADPGHAGNWPVGGPGTTADALLVVRAADDGAAAALADRLTAGPGGPRVLHRDRCASLAGEGHRYEREHFGYRDPVSQPAVRGVAADTGEPLSPVTDPERPEEALPGQRRLWPGEFVFGHPGQDPLLSDTPGPVVSGGPDWTVNGSLLVTRRYRQDVDSFFAFADRAAAELARRGFPGWSPDAISSRLFGRWRDGTPVSLRPNGPDPRVSSCPLSDNDFGFTAERGPVDDTRGWRVPVGAHIRKAYPRDHETDLETTAAIETHRLLRRGMPYADRGERGMAFACYQTSLERQFEFVVRSWLNNPYQQHEGDNHDPIVGRPHRPLGDRVPREFVLRMPSGDSEGTLVRLPMPEPFTAPRGGGYFFTPSLSALRALTR
ncbi:Dyp-type peroxidase [Nocardiopsis sp. N85]|uniref:Dyp-type peroxidase n=1 Tax=Nocardiopsis sp. N85 TaxID=3029400 RepID=UPI00237F9AC6|nr:Dyp-type peroxidase [Nocardiopsis sp. N85]MDE3723229.1 Dyp-type peroxidase [Nocardiopsis sp. N85]